jgi:hypothetical protein
LWYINGHRPPIITPILRTLINITICSWFVLPILFSQLIFCIICLSLCWFFSFVGNQLHHSLLINHIVFIVVFLWWGLRMICSSTKIIVSWWLETIWLTKLLSLSKILLTTQMQLISKVSFYMCPHHIFLEQNLIWTRWQNSYFFGQLFE